MIRRWSLVIAALAIALVASARPVKKKSRKVLEKASGPVACNLLSVDLDEAKAEVLISGVVHEPEARLFVFHDNRDRHYIALDAHCEKTPDNKMKCALELPRPYLRAKVTGITFQVRQNKEVELDGKQVEAIFTEARAHRRPQDGGLPKGDGGEPDYWEPESNKGDGGLQIPRGSEGESSDTEEWKMLSPQPR